MKHLIIRNLKIFFRDRSNVFYSLLAVVIIIGLYVLFIGDMATKDLTGIKNARRLMDCWIMAGTLAVSTLTATLGAFGTMVEDRAKKLIKDFSASPLTRRSLAAGYIVSSFTVGIIISLITFVFAEIYILAYGGHLLDFPSLLKLLGVMALSVLASGSMVCLLVSFFKSMGAFGTASTIIGTLMGFLTGTYMPVGSFPNAVQWVIKLFPVSHAGALMRQIMMDAPLRVSFDGAPAGAADDFKRGVGAVFTYGGADFPWWGSVLVLAATTAVFYSLSLWRLTRKSG